MSLYKGEVLISGAARIKSVQCTLAEYTLWANNHILDPDTYYEIYDDTTPVVIKSVDCTFGEYQAWVQEGSIDPECYYNITDDNAVGEEGAIIDSYISSVTTWSSQKIEEELSKGRTWAPIETG